MGTSLQKNKGNGVSRDHPHAYGDKLASAFNMDKVEGSSPRVWGQGFVILGYKGIDRIIPTRMGTRNLIKTNHRILRDHPHAYGDKL